MQVNLIFHDIVISSAKINNKYTITKDYFLSLMEEIGRSTKNKKTLFMKYRIYFDDGYTSFHDTIYPLLYNKPWEVTLAIVTDNLDSEGFLKSRILREYFNQGIKIASHGTSHAALAVYKDGKLQDTPSGGKYNNSPRGQREPLSENEIIYQYYESKKYLESLLSIEIDEFVFPYGLYNSQVVFLNSKYGFYKYLSTCDEHLDFGASLRPRVLINNERTIPETIKYLTSFSRPDFTPPRTGFLNINLYS